VTKFDVKAGHLGTPSLSRGSIRPLQLIVIETVQVIILTVAVDVSNYPVHSVWHTTTPLIATFRCVCVSLSLLLAAMRAEQAGMAIAHDHGLQGEALCAQQACLSLGTTTCMQCGHTRSDLEFRLELQSIEFSDRERTTKIGFLHTVRHIALPRKRLYCRINTALHLHCSPAQISIA
jgi:hypothetical protein